MINEGVLRNEDEPWYKNKELILILSSLIFALILWQLGRWHREWNYILIFVIGGTLFQATMYPKNRYDNKTKVQTPNNDYSMHPDSDIKIGGYHILPCGGFSVKNWIPITKGAEGTIIVPEELVKKFGRTYIVLGEPTEVRYSELPSVAQDAVDNHDDVEEPYRMTRYIEWDGIDKEEFEDKLDTLLIQEEQIKDMNDRMTEIRSMLKEKQSDIEDHSDFVRRVGNSDSKLDKVRKAMGNESEKEE